jgi:hypothetical protein
LISLNQRVPHHLAGNRRYAVVIAAPKFGLKDPRVLFARATVGWTQHAAKPPEFLRLMFWSYVDADQFHCQFQQRRHS